MKMTHEFRVGAGMAGLLMACLAVSGCSPTYGTSKTATEQLFSDLGDATALTGPKQAQNVKYAPRPGIVLPADGERQELVQPQQSLAGKDNPQWVESPEETRMRLSVEAEENKNNPNFRSPLAKTTVNGRQLSTAEQLEKYRAARRDQKGAYDERRYLSDPPSKYREVSNAATLDDLGEPEVKKEKRRKKEAQMAKRSSSWWNPFQ